VDLRLQLVVAKDKHVASKAANAGRPDVPNQQPRRLRAAKRSSAPIANQGRPVLPAPRVIVANSGFWKYPGGLDYGLILENTSKTRDARTVVVTVRAVDERERAVATNRTPLTGIPAAGRFVVTDTFQSSVLPRVTKLRTTIRVGHGSSPSLRLPPTTNVRFSGDLGLLEVTGQVNNPYKKPLTESAPIFAILLDKRGRIVAANSPVVASGTWEATELLEYQSYGCGEVFGDPLPDNFCGGVVKMRVTLMPTGTSLHLPGILAFTHTTATGTG
jgi:hypothetical protein